MVLLIHANGRSTIQRFGNTINPFTFTGRQTGNRIQPKHWRTQVGVLWKVLFEKGVKLHFGYTMFKWWNEGKYKAAVHCVIIGFSLHEADNKRIFEEHNGKIKARKVKNINPYLIDAPNVLIDNRSKPLCDVPEMGIGNKPIDGGNYLFTHEEKRAFLKLEPAAAPYFRKWMGAAEFINGWHRWCLWLGDCPPRELRKMKECMKRVEAVHELRLASKSLPTQKLAEKPTRFHVENMPAKKYILIPRVSSERRKYVPVGFVSPKILASDATLILQNAGLYHFGILTSIVHNAWMRRVCGRLEIDYRYSARTVYNNFPWPEVTEKQKEKIEKLAQNVLDARAKFPENSLADLYDPLAMPPSLLKAHQTLDKAVLKLYNFGEAWEESKIVAGLMEAFRELTTEEEQCP